MTLFGCALLLPINLSARFLGSFAGSVIFNCLCTLGTAPELCMGKTGTKSLRALVENVADHLGGGVHVAHHTIFSNPQTDCYVIIYIITI